MKKFKVLSQILSTLSISVLVCFSVNAMESDINSKPSENINKINIIEDVPNQIETNSEVDFSNSTLKQQKPGKNKKNQQRRNRTKRLNEKTKEENKEEEKINDEILNLSEKIYKTKNLIKTLEKKDSTKTTQSENKKAAFPEEIVDLLTIKDEFIEYISNKDKNENKKKFPKLEKFLDELKIQVKKINKLIKSSSLNMEIESLYQSAKDLYQYLNFKNITIKDGIKFLFNLTPEEELKFLKHKKELIDILNNRNLNIDEINEKVSNCSNFIIDGLKALDEKAKV